LVIYNQGRSQDFTLGDTEAERLLLRKLKNNNSY